MFGLKVLQQEGRAVGGGHRDAHPTLWHAGAALDARFLGGVFGQVNVPRYGIEGVVAMPEACFESFWGSWWQEDWEVREDEQFIQSKKTVGSLSQGG